MQYLREHRPTYLAHSALIDAMIHRVPLADVVRMHRPDLRLAELRAPDETAGTGKREAGRGNGVVSLALRAVEALERGGAPVERIGLGGSLLLGAQHAESDIDLVVYGRAAFEAARRALGAAVASGRLEPLDRGQWEAAWSRRGSDLTLDEYVTRRGAEAEQGAGRWHAGGPDAWWWIGTRRCRSGGRSGSWDGSW